ncbi:MAG: hypothetical protein LCH98_12250 [Actinobacteria bacterium]|nr:hypothetical protein [Actinomycetota bacterium]
MVSHHGADHRQEAEQWRRSRTRRIAAVGALLAAALITLTACAAGPNTVPPGTDAPGFWWGLWHGFISPIAFLVSVFNDDVSIYAVRNSGNWYNFGFMVGLSVIFGATRPRRRRH